MPLLRNSCVAAAPYSTSHVSIAILAPCWMQLRGARLLLLQLVVADLDLEVRPARFGELRRLDLRAGERRRVERLHAARQVDRRADDDRRCVRRALAGSGRRRRRESRSQPPRPRARRRSNDLGFLIVPPRKGVRQSDLTLVEYARSTSLGLALRRAPVDLRVHDADRRASRRTSPRTGRPGVEGIGVCEFKLGDRSARAAARERAARDALHPGGAVDPAAAADGGAGRAGGAGRGAVRERSAARGARARLRRLPHRPGRGATRSSAKGSARSPRRAGGGRPRRARAGALRRRPTRSRSCTRSRTRSS